MDRKEKRHFIDTVTDNWEYSWTPLIAEGDTWIAVCGDEVASDEPQYSAPFPFVMKGETPSREAVADLLNEKFKTRVGRTFREAGRNL